jgi:hypothetical protein
MVATQGGWKDWKVLRRYTHIKAEHIAEKFAEEEIPSPL